MNVQLEDLLADYPSTDTPGIQTIVTGKKEFAELASGVREPAPRPGQYYKHQRLLIRYMQMSDTLLAIHDPGTGKTCTVTGISEFFKRQAALGLSRIKRAYFLTRGRSTKQDLRNQILCKCTAGEYKTPMVMNTQDEAARKRNITRELGKWYQIDTYRKFVNSVVRPTIKTRSPTGETTTRELPPLTDAEIIERFNDTIIFVDEVHNLRGDVVLVGDEDEEERTRRQDEATVMREVYNVLFRIFHLVPRRKVILASATPIINSVNELGPIMNLILPLDMQFPAQYPFETATLEDLEPYFRGRLSYVRALDTGAVPVYQGEPIEAEFEFQGEMVQSQTIVYASQMDPRVQLQGYENAEQRQTQDFHSAERQAANFVFPDLSYGGSFPRTKKTTDAEGIGRYVQSPAPDRYIVQPELREWISNIDYLRALSAKFAAIIQLVSQETRGTCFCYSDFMTGSGAILLGLCFEAMGFQRYDQSQSMFTTTNQLGPADPCEAGVETGTRVPRLPPAPRYGLLTSETSDAKQHSLMEAFNSYENRHGDYVRVLIGSPVTRDGINLANVVQVHLVTPGWHQSGMFQALSRALRATSHEALLAEARAAAEAEGRDPAAAFVEVKIYKHAAVTPEGRSIDLEMYQVAEQKDREIHRVLRIMKQCAVDCQIHRARNIRATDTPNSPACDYGECDYVCVDPAPTALDYTTYDVFYSDEVVAEAAADIQELFRTRASITVEELYTILPQYRRKFIDTALQDLIDSKAIFYDRSGFQSFLRIDKGTVFLVRDYPITDHAERFPVSYYVDTTVATLPLSLGDYLVRLQAEGQQALVQQLAQIPPTDPRFLELLNRFNTETKVQLLEQALQQIINNQATELANAIYARFQANVFVFREPVAEIELFAQAVANRGRGRGRKPKEEGKPRQLIELARRVVEQAEAQGTDTQGEIVYIHNLYNQQEQLVSYAVMNRLNRAEGRLRILKPSEQIGWRDVNPQEQPVYNARIALETERRKAPFEEQPIYGILPRDKKFRIRDRRTETEATQDRDKRRGKICTTWNKQKLVDFAWDFQIPPPALRRELTDRGQILQYLSQQMPDRIQELTEFDDNRLMFYYRYYRGMGREELCAVLEQYFREHNLILEIE